MAAEVLPSVGARFGGPLNESVQKTSQRRPSPVRAHTEGSLAETARAPRSMTEAESTYYDKIATTIHGYCVLDETLQPICCRTKYENCMRDINRDGCIGSLGYGTACFSEHDARDPSCLRDQTAVQVLQCYAVNSDPGKCKTSVQGSATEFSPPLELFVVWDFYEKDKRVDKKIYQYDQMWASLKKAGIGGRDSFIQSFVDNGESVAKFDQIVDSHETIWGKLYKFLLYMVAESLSAPLDRDPRVFWCVQPTYKDCISKCLGQQLDDEGDPVAAAENDAFEKAEDKMCGHYSPAIGDSEALQKRLPRMSRPYRLRYDPERPENCHKKDRNPDGTCPYPQCMPLLAHLTKDLSDD
jgi:hypothetical protein